MSVELLQRLIEAGTPAALIAEVAQALSDASADQRTLDRRRAADAARQKTKRDREKEAASRDITLGTVTSRDEADESPSLDKSPQTPKINPTPHTGGAPTCVREAETPAGIQPLSFAIAIVSTAWTLRAARWKGTPPPAGVADDCWAGFIEHRKVHPKGGKLTDRAYRLLCNKLADLADAGFPPGAMLDRAVEHGWITVYPPKEPAHVRHRPANDRDGHLNPMVRAGLAREALFADRSDH